jgi:ElaB/YqjD/DUF883 family membrane-anchored ribosome-binding protein
MATKTTEGADELREELSALRGDLAALVETVKEMGRERADSAIHSAKETVDHAAQRFKVSAEEARERGEAAADEIGAMVTRHPVSAVFVALGIGYLVGRIRG